MPTVKDLVDEVQTLASELSDRIDASDKEQKRRSEELTSKTAAIAAEHKQATDRVNARINELTDQIERERIAAARPPLAGEKKKYRNSPEHQAFIKAMKARGDIHTLTMEEKQMIVKEYMPAERKALYASDATTGGFFASTDFLEELIEYKLLISPMRKVCRIQQTSGEKVQMPSLQQDTTAYWATEQSAFTDSSNPTIGMINIPVHEIRGLLRVSQQNLEDSMFNLEDLIKERLMLKFAQAEGTAFIKGNGVGQPRGILDYPQATTASFTGGSAGKNTNVQQIATVASTGTSGKITADDVLNVKMDLKAYYDPNATYIFTRGTLNTIRLFKDSQNRPLWQPFAGQGLPSLIYDAPYVEMPDMPEIASAATPIGVGDFQYYMIVDRITLNIQQLNELYIASGLIGFIARMRVGGDCLLPEAFRLLLVN
jgi:HK97 family phage major capsid protein